MANGETATFQLVVKVNANTPSGNTMSNTAYVSSNTYQTNSTATGDDPSDRG